MAGNESAVCGGQWSHPAVRNKPDRLRLYVAVLHALLAAAESGDTSYCRIRAVVAGEHEYDIGAFGNVFRPNQQLHICRTIFHGRSRLGISDTDKFEPEWCFKSMALRRRQSGVADFGCSFDEWARHSPH